jgi:peptidoglycan/LPS O-acetylase OafA/YrhL
LRILPNYLFVVGLYFIFPVVREYPLKTPLWEFLTFTQNLSAIELPAAFSHAWSLCIEEHFYLVLPLLALVFVRRPSVRAAWITIFTILVLEIVIRSFIWAQYLREAGDHFKVLYRELIYAPTYSRLDSLTLGVALAILKNFHAPLWEKITDHGNLFLAFGIMGYAMVEYTFQQSAHADFFAVVLNYSLLSFSSMSLVLSALSQKTLLNHIKIPGVTWLAIGSYAIYLTHKMFIHAIFVAFNKIQLENMDMLLFAACMLASMIGGALLYVCIEKPFQKLRGSLRAS